MKRTVLMALLGLTFALANGAARAQVAGTTTLGIAVTAVQDVAVGWSAKKQIIGHVVYNDAGDKVGRIDDLIVTPDSSVSFAIVGTGGFVGIKRHHVAIPVEQIVTTVSTSPAERPALASALRATSTNSASAPSRNACVRSGQPRRSRYHSIGLTP